MGTASLVIGILSLMVSLIPLLGITAFFPAAVGLILGCVYNQRAEKLSIPKNTAGITLNSIAICFSLVSMILTYVVGELLKAGWAHTVDNWRMLSVDIKSLLELLGF